MRISVQVIMEKHYEFPEEERLTEESVREAVNAAKSDFAVPDGAVVVDESWSVSL